MVVIAIVHSGWGFKIDFTCSSSHGHETVENLRSNPLTTSFPFFHPFRRSFSSLKIPLIINWLYVIIKAFCLTMLSHVIFAGGNAGVGLETAVDMATRGAKVVLGCRNEERAQRAVQIIKRRYRFILLYW